MAMSDSESLRLVRPEENDGDSIPFERRAYHRRAVSGRVTAVRATPEAPDIKSHICSLELLDMSDVGLGALIQEPVEIDTSITVFFPPHGVDRGFDLYGKITRCEASEYGYQIGIAFDEHSSQSRTAS
jgi:hypothetical protein